MRVLGLDVGERRVGVAISDPGESLAVPKTTLTRAAGMAPLAKLVADEDIHVTVWVDAETGDTLREDSTVLLPSGIGQLPVGTRFAQIAAVSLLGGIGFTMSIFIAQLGYAANAELLLMAKMGILTASLVAGVAGFVWLFLLGRRR